MIFIHSNEHNDKCMEKKLLRVVGGHKTIDQNRERAVASARGVLRGRRSPALSHKALFEKLQATFPEIHEMQTPDDMNKRCRNGTALITASLKGLG